MAAKLNQISKPKKHKLMLTRTHERNGIYTVELRHQKCQIRSRGIQEYELLEESLEVGGDIARI